MRGGGEEGVLSWLGKEAALCHSVRGLALAQCRISLCVFPSYRGSSVLSTFHALPQVFLPCRTCQEETAWPTQRHFESLRSIESGVDDR